MTRDHVLGVVRKHLASTLDGIEPESIETHLSMKELGANSLDIVEVVSASMRELRVKIPRSELAKLENLDGLVELLHKAATEKAAAGT